MKRFMLGMLAAVMTISLVLIGVNSEAAKVPNVVKRPISTAMRILSKAGLKGRSQGPHVGTKKKALIGKVAGQSIRPGKSVPRGTWVNLKVFRLAAKPARVKVPNVVKRPSSLAMRILNKAGLKSRPRNVPTKKKALNGKVAAQSIKPGKSVPRGTWVNLKVFRFAAKHIIDPTHAKLSIARAAYLKARNNGRALCKRLRDKRARESCARGFR